MSGKQDSKKTKKTEISLGAQESTELEMILDRLAVQSPEGESLQSYLQSLRKALLGRDDLVAALLDKLSRNITPVAFRAFVALQDIVKKKEYRRTIKQAAYRFNQKGYGGDAEDLPQDKVVLIPKESRQAVCHIVPAPDVDWFVAGFFPGEGGSTPLAVSAYTEHRFRELSVRVVESSHKLYREFIQKLAGHIPETPPFEVPAWHAAGIYFEMLRFQGEKAASGDVEQARKLFTPFHDPNKRPYAHQLFAPLEDPGARLQEVDAGGFVREAPVEPLLFRKEEVTPYFEKMQAMEQSVLVVRREVKQERTAELLQRAADELCAGENRSLYQRLFEELALSLRQTKKPDLASQAWIVAQHLAGSGKASENPVITGLIELSMHLYWPDEFNADQQQPAASYEQTESGLILPR